MTDTEFAILGLVHEEERHGYQIEAVIEERGMREWTAVGFSSIYYLLKKLEKKAFISSLVLKSKLVLYPLSYFYLEENEG